MPLKNRILLFAWFFYFCSLPLFKAFSSIAEVALVILSFWPGSFQSLKPTVLKYKGVAAITLIFLVLVLGMLYTEDLKAGYKLLKHQHRFLVIPLLFLVHAKLLREHFKKLTLAFVLAATAACAFTVLLYLLPEDLVRPFANSTNLLLDYPDTASRTKYGLYTPFIDRIQFSSLTAVAIISGLYLVLAGYKRKLLFVALPLLFYTMLILGGRGAQLALFVALLAFAFMVTVNLIAPKLAQRWGKFRSRLFLILLALLLFIGLPYLSYKTLPPIQSRVGQTQWEIEVMRSGELQEYDYAHFTTLRRIVSWQNLWQVIQQNPILGVGTGDYLNALDAAYKDDAVTVQRHNHSQYLMVWAMTGVWGLAIFLGVQVYWLWQMRYGRLTFYYAAAFLIFYLVNMIPDAVLYTQLDSTSFCTFLSLIGLQARFNQLDHA